MTTKRSRPKDRRGLLEETFRAAVDAADPLKILAQHLPHPPAGRTVVVGAGKAAASMALAVERAWPAGAPLDGLVITRYQHELPTRRIRVVEAAHPVPDAAGEAAARDILDLARSLSEDDLLLVLISGGGSALLSLPAEGLSLDDIQATTAGLLDCGAPIQSLNTVRKHLSKIQGGRLAAATRARVLALIISDVTGDDPTHIASGPCAPDPGTYADALAILDKYAVSAPLAIVDHLRAGATGLRPETPKPGDPAFDRTENRVIATSQESLQRAAAICRERGIPAVVLGDAVTGEARDVAGAYAALIRQVLLHAEPWSAPVALLSGGECTVTVRGNATNRGKGGRCSEFLLALGLELEALGCDPLRVSALAADTDGIDGSGENAGAVLDSSTLRRSREYGIEPRRALDANNSYAVFDAAHGLVITGPTRTNVNDFRIFLIDQDVRLPLTEDSR